MREIPGGRESPRALHNGGLQQSSVGKYLKRTYVRDIFSVSDLVPRSQYFRPHECEVLGLKRRRYNCSGL